MHVCYKNDSLVSYHFMNGLVENEEDLKSLVRAIHNWLYPLRASMGIITAKLSNNPQFSKLINIYEEELMNAQENYRLDF
jgi:hypothetical protein